MGRLGSGAFACLVLVLLAGAGRAEDYPSRLVKIVVPFASGSTTDIVARLLADPLGRKWGANVVVENISGASGNVGAERVARAAADGSALMVGPPGPLAINRFLYNDLAYDASQFTPITLLAKVPNVLTVRSTLPLKSLADIIAYAKQNPGSLTYATQGAGSTAFLTTSRLQKLAGISMVHVPYRGAALALNDLIAGHVDLMFDTLTTSLPLHRGGQARIVAVASAERAGVLPDIATVQESGLPGFRSVTWFALVAPPGMPGALTARINRDVIDILRTPDLTERLRELMLEPGGGTPEETARFIAEESELWGRVVKEANVSLQ